jgi:hypothetical protein
MVYLCIGIRVGRDEVIGDNHQKMNDCRRFPTLWNRNVYKIRLTDLPICICFYVILRLFVRSLNSVIFTIRLTYETQNGPYDDGCF